MKISVIVPLYNAESYLEKCILSVLNQTYSNWELILIDDGSNDKSGEIIDMATQRDHRIIALHQENKGAGSSRNKGIDIATGDYVVFLDADDFIDPDYFQLLIPLAKNNDIVFIDAMQLSVTGKRLCNELMSIYEKWDKDRILRSQLTGKISWGAWRKAVRLSLIKENQIYFTEHCIGEETLYSFQLLNATSKIGFIKNKPVYYYINHDESLSKTKMEDPWGSVVLAVKKYLKEKELYEKFADTINAFNISATVVSLDRINQQYKGRKKKEKAIARIEEFYNLYDRNAGIDYKNLSYKAKIFVPFILKKNYFPVFLCSKIRQIL